MDASPTLSTTEIVSANLRMVLRGLLAALGVWRLEPVMGLAMYRRVSRTMSRIERMLVRFRLGTLWRMPHRDAKAGRRARGKSVMALPRRFGWLAQAGGHQAACVGLQLQAALTTPEMAELLAVSAQARRILQPVCRALAVELPGIEVHAATQGSEPTRRRTTARAQTEAFRIPLPRGVLTAARRVGFGKDR